jgi:hypothetical protein
MSLEGIKAQLTELLAHLLQIGRDSPDLLMFLGSLVTDDTLGEVKAKKKKKKKKKNRILKPGNFVIISIQFFSVGSIFIDFTNV